MTYLVAKINILYYFVSYRQWHFLRMIRINSGYSQDTHGWHGNRAVNCWREISLKWRDKNLFKFVSLSHIKCFPVNLSLFKMVNERVARIVQVRKKWTNYFPSYNKLMLLRNPLSQPLNHKLPEAIFLSIKLI